VVLCVDEKSQIQALDRTQPLSPMQPGDRSTASSPSLGGIPQVLRYYRIAGASGLEVHLIVDNYATHKTAIIRKWFAKRSRFHVHFTPTYGSWINLVERWFAELTNKRIRRGVFRSVKELEAAIRQYIEVHNEDPTPFVWTRTADQILASIARYAQRTTRLTSRTIRTGD
jgi:transposase